MEITYIIFIYFFTENCISLAVRMRHIMLENCTPIRLFERSWCIPSIINRPVKTKFEDRPAKQIRQLADLAITK